MSHRYLDHTADLAVEVRAASLNQLFAEAATALTECLVEPARVASREQRGIELEASDLERLLVAWLHEVLFAFETHRLLALRAEVAVEPGEGGGWRLRGALFGEPVDFELHPPKVLIKGISYHGLHVEQTGGGWLAKLVFDI